MALDRIENLLEKYFEAQTSIAEEKELKAYFSSADVAPPLEQYKPIFGYAVQAKQEQFTATIPLKTKKRSSVVWMSVAATAVVIIGAGIFTFTNYQEPKPQNLGAIDDPEVAFRETQKALNLISEHVNKGIGSMGYLNEYKQSKNKIFK